MPLNWRRRRERRQKKVENIKAVNTGIEDFVNWVDPISSELAEEREDDMSSLTIGFDVRMCKLATSS